MAASSIGRSNILLIHWHNTISRHTRENIHSALHQHILTAYNRHNHRQHYIHAAATVISTCITLALANHSHKTLSAQHHQHNISSALHTIGTTHYRHYILSALHTIGTTYYRHYILSAQHTISTTHYQHNTLSALYTIGTTYYRHYILSALHTIGTTYYRHYILSAHHTCDTAHYWHYVHDTIPIFCWQMQDLPLQ